MSSLFLLEKIPFQKALIAQESRQKKRKSVAPLSIQNLINIDSTLVQRNDVDFMFSVYVGSVSRMAIKMWPCFCTLQERISHPACTKRKKNRSTIIC